MNTFLIAFAIAMMYITPGPNNTMLAASAASYGMRATVPHMLGIAGGFAFMMAAVCCGLAGRAGLAAVVTDHAVGRRGMDAAARVEDRHRGVARGSAIPRRGRVLGFGGAAAFQWVNPKGWLIAIAAAGMFIAARILWTQTAWIGAVFFAVAFPCMLPWVLLGAAAGRLLRSPLRARVFNVAMGLLLVASVPLLLD